MYHGPVVHVFDEKLHNNNIDYKDHIQQHTGRAFVPWGSSSFMDCISGEYCYINVFLQVKYNITALHVIAFAANTFECNIIFLVQITCDRSCKMSTVTGQRFYNNSTSCCHNHNCGTVLYICNIKCIVLYCIVLFYYL